MYRHAIATLVAGVLAGAPAVWAQVAWPEIVLSVAPSPLPVGSTGRLQIQINATERLSNAVLIATATEGLTVSPGRMVVGRVDPPSAGPRTPIFNPSPPALGVVPVRNFRVAPSRWGDFEVTVTLSYDGGSISRSLTVSAR